MDLLSLSIELPRFFLLAESPASLLFGGNDLFLDLCPNIGCSCSCSCGLRLSCIGASHDFRFPLADSLPHEGWAVGFSHITAIHKQVNDGNIPSVVIDLTFPISKSIEQAWTHIPVSLEGKARAIMDMIGMAPHFAVLCLHQQEFEVIWRSQVLGNPCLAHRIFPKHIAFLTT